MRNLRLIALTFVAVIVQTTVLRYFAIGGIVPNLTVVCVICFGLVHPSFTFVVIYGLLCGAVLDATSTTVFGLHALLCTLCSALCYVASTRFFKGKYPVCLLFAFALSLIYESVYYAAAFAINYNSSVLHAIVYTALPTAVYNTVLAMPLLFIMQRLYEDKDD